MRDQIPPAELPSIKESEEVLRRRHFAAASALVVVAIFYLSWVPFEPRAISLGEGLRLFREIIKGGMALPFSRQDVVLNMIAGIPLGFTLLGSLLCRQRGLFRVLAAVVAVLVLSLGFSFAAEFGQVWLDGRVSSPRDIMAQGAGAAVGILFWLLIGNRFVEIIDEIFRERQQSTKLKRLLNLYAIGFFVWSLLPFTVVTNVNELGRKFVNGKVELVLFSFPYASRSDMAHALLLDAIVYIPIGVWATLTAMRGDLKVFNPSAALTLGIIYSVALESAQLLIRGRYSSTTDVLCAGVGVIVGILVTRFVLQSLIRFDLGRNDSLFHNTGFWGLIGVAYSGLLLVVFWGPIEEIVYNSELIRARLRAFVDVPFRRLQSSSSSTATLFVVIRNFAWFAPLGAVCAAFAYCVTPSPTARRRWLVVGLVGISALALIIELGQVVMPSRSPDVTEVLIRMVGGMCGLILGVTACRRLFLRSALLR